MSIAAKPSTETRHSGNVVCPWCGHRHRDASEMVDYQSEEWRDGECGECEKPIRYRVVVMYTYVCEPILK